MGDVHLRQPDPSFREVGGRRPVPHPFKGMDDYWSGRLDTFSSAIESAHCFWHVCNDWPAGNSGCRFDNCTFVGWLGEYLRSRSERWDLGHDDCDVSPG